VRLEEKLQCDSRTAVGVGAQGELVEGAADLGELLIFGGVMFLSPDEGVGEQAPR